MNKKKRMNSWMIFQIGWRGIKLQLFCNSLKKLTGFLSLFFRVSILRGLRNFLSFKSDASSSLADRITSLDATCYTLLGRDAPDVPAALRSIAIGFTGDTLGSGRKSSRTSIDEVEKWWQANGKGLPLMLYIQDAQTMPASVLSEITYILALHAGLPVRLLLSVSSAAVFLSSWGHIEPSSIDVSILRSGRSRRGAGGIDSIIRSSFEAPFKISEDLAEELRSNEALLGGGVAAAMKTLKVPPPLFSNDRRC